LPKIAISTLRPTGKATNEENENGLGTDQHLIIVYGNVLGESFVANEKRPDAQVT
jgi:hypothetical protein